jgi:hypothetical protein
VKLKMRFVQIDQQRMTIALRDRLQELDTPLAKNFFAGTGTLEGQSYAVGIRKPWGVGDCFMCEPVLIDLPGGTHAVYVVQDGTFDSSTVGRNDRRGSLTISREANYASTAALFSTAPSAGAVKRWPGGGALGIGGAYASIITCDISFGGTSDKLAHRCLEACALRAGISSGDISSSDLTTLDSSPTVNSGYRRALIQPRISPSAGTSAASTRSTNGRVQLHLEGVTPILSWLPTLMSGTGSSAARTDLPAPAEGHERVLMVSP